MTNTTNNANHLGKLFSQICDSMCEAGAKFIVNLN